jgi:hypothetical protein
VHSVEFAVAVARVAVHLRVTRFELSLLHVHRGATDLRELVELFTESADVALQLLAS